VIMRYPWPLVLPGLAARFLTQFRYACRQGLWWREPLVWIAVLARLPLALAHRRPVTARTVRISLGVNRGNVRDPRAAWELGNQGWWKILTAKPWIYAPNNPGPSSPRIDDLSAVPTEKHSAT
jgi:hypothetical protein